MCPFSNLYAIRDNDADKIKGLSLGAYNIREKSRRKMARQLVYI
jgi:hypothetical protein